MSPKVTVFVPVYNRERYVGETIESILGQTFQDFELLIVDDGSTDRSREVIDRFADPRIRLESNSRNLGIPRTRNRGLELARGEYLALLDSDDLAHPKRLERQVRFLDERTEYAEIGTWCGFIDERGRRLRRVKRHASDTDDIRAEMLFRCPISNRSVMGRVETLRNYPYRSSFPVCEDVDVHCRLARDHSVGNLPEILVYGREHDARTSDLHETERTGLQMRIKAELLEALGLEASPQELVRHLAIGRRRAEADADASDLEWVDRWLSRLWEANEHEVIYQRAALARTLGMMWVATCWHARAGRTSRLPRLFARSPWASRAVLYARHWVGRFLQRHDPA